MEQWIIDTRKYLDMIEGPYAEPFDGITRSHHVYRQLCGKYGLESIDRWMDWYFNDSRDY